MVRLADLAESDQEVLLRLPCPRMEPAAWVRPKPLETSRVALVTTAGLHLRESESFGLLDASYRVIPGDVKAGDLVMTHSSVNFDRTGFQEDTNVVLPIDRFRELAEGGTLGELAGYHYSFMSAGLQPEVFEEPARELAGKLRRDSVDTVFLTGV